MNSGRIDVFFDLGVDVVFDFPQFPCVDAVCAVQKMEKEGPLFEPQASFGPSHFLYRTNGNPLQGATTPGSPSLAYLSWRRKKGM